MRRQKVCLIAVAVLATTLAGGCSSMERAFDDVMDRGDDDDRSRADRVDLNSAGRRRLAALPGISDDEADKIVASRPYENRRDLVRKRVLSEDEFERVKDYVYVDREKD